MTEIRIRETEKAIGRDLAHHLSPVIVNEKGDVVDGNHRLASDAEWTKRTVPLSDFDTHRARLILNAARREVEAADYNAFAKFLRETELGKKTWRVKSGQTIAARISEATGIPEDTVREYLDEKYKGPTGPTGDTPISLGKGEQIRVPKVLAPEIKTLVDQVKSSASEAPELRKEVIRNAKARLRDHSKELRSASKMTPTLRKFVESGTLKLQIAKLIECKVPPKFFEDEANHIVENRLSPEQAEAYLASQEPIYKVHQIGQKLGNHNSLGQSAKLAAPFFKLHESTIRGRVEQGFNLENPELTDRRKCIQLFQEIRDALRKVSVGDEVEVIVTIWAAAKAKPIEVK